MASKNDQLRATMQHDIRESEENTKRIVDEINMLTKEIQHDQRDLAEVRMRAEKVLIKIEATRRSLRGLEDEYTMHKKEYDDGRRRVERVNRNIKMLSDQARGLKIKREKMQSELEKLSRAQ